MLSIVELRKQQAEGAKKAAKRRKEIATQQLRINQALKKLGALITPGLWVAPEEVRSWVRTEIERVLHKTEVQRKQAKELIDGLNAYAINKKYEAEQKAAAEAKKKTAPTAASQSGPPVP